MQATAGSYQNVHYDSRANHPFSWRSARLRCSCSQHALNSVYDADFPRSNVFKVLPPTSTKPQVHPTPETQHLPSKRMEACTYLWMSALQGGPHKPDAKCLTLVSGTSLNEIPYPTRGVPLLRPQLQSKRLESSLFTIRYKGLPTKCK